MKTEKKKNDLSLRLLEVFGGVMLHQTTVDAASELGISQPAVSIAIKQLEGHVGFPLFERRNQRLHPTEEARRLFAQVEPILLQLRSVEGYIQDLRDRSTGNLRILATPPLGHSVVPRVLKRFLADRTGVTVQYDVRRMEDVIQEIEIGSAELGLVLALDGHPAVNVHRLSTDRMVALLPADHELVEKTEVSPEDCIKHGHIGLDPGSRLGVLLRTAFNSAGVPYLPRVVVRYCHTAAVLADAGMGVSIVDRYTASFMAGQGLVSRPFLPEIPVGACLLSRRNTPLSRLAAGFVETLEAGFDSGMPQT